MEKVAFPGAQPGAGVLYVVATPIGNLEDITLRALRVLKAVQLIAAEDTRHTRKLLQAFDITAPVTSLHEHNEVEKGKLLLEKLLAGQDVAYVSDAGTPVVSDPGYRLVKAAALANIRVVPVPGPSAVGAALSVAGLPADAFVFAGFLPSRAAARRERLAALREEPRTLVFYEAPHRLAVTLQDMTAEFGDREAVVCRELTKLFEEILRGTLAEVFILLQGRRIRGEITLVVAGCKTTAPVITETDLVAMAQRLQQEGMSRRDLVDALVRETGLSRRVVYQKIGTAPTPSTGACDRGD